MIKNIFSNSAAISAVMIIQLVTIPILVSKMGLSDYGEYMAIFGLIGLVTVLSDLGLDMFITKQIAADIDDSPRMISSFFWLKLIACLIAIPILVIAIIVFVNSDDNYVLLYSIIWFVGLNFRPTALFNGLEKYFENMIFEVVGKLVFLFTIISYKGEEFSVSQLLGFSGCIAILTSAFMFYFLRHLNLLIFKSASVDYIKVVLRGSLGFFTPRLLSNIYMKSSVFFCAILLPAYETGIYAVSIQLYKVGQALIGAVSRVLYTSTVKTKNIQNVRRATVLTLLLQASCLLIVLPYGEEIINIILGIDDPLIYQISVILYVSLFFVTIGSYYGYPIMVAFGKETYAHAGIFLGSFSYYLFLLLFWLLGMINLYSIVALVLIVDIFCAAIRYYFYYFKIRKDVFCL